MEDPYQDTEWNDALRKAGILPPKVDPRKNEPEPEPEPVSSTMTKDGTKDFATMSLNELDDFEDDDPEIFEEYKRKRMAEMKEAASKRKFGNVTEISGIDFVQEVNKAGECIWVVLHLYKQGIPLCALINRHLAGLAHKFPEVKFLKSIATTCVPNFPESSLPAVFLYYEGDLRRQLVGALEFGGMNLSQDGLEWMLAQQKVLQTSLTEDPRVSGNKTNINTVRGRARHDDSDSD